MIRKDKGSYRCYCCFSQIAVTDDGCEIVPLMVKRDDDGNIANEIVYHWEVCTDAKRKAVSEEHASKHWKDVWIDV